MLSLSVKTHWKMAFKSFKKAFKVTVNEFLRGIKLQYHMNRRYDDLMSKKKFVVTLDKATDE